MTEALNPIPLLRVVAEAVSDSARDLRSACLIGSAAQEIISSGRLGSARDCDLVILLERSFRFGDVLLDVKKVEATVNAVPSLPIRIWFTYNGLGPGPTDKGVLTVDIIPHSVYFLSHDDPFTVIDIAHRGYIMIKGEDAYARFAVGPVPPELCLRRVTEIENYIKRESLDAQTHPRYVAKSAILVASLLVVDHMVSLDKGRIIDTVVAEHPSLADDLAAVHRVYRGTELRSSELPAIHSRVVEYTKGVLNNRVHATRYPRA